VLMSCRRVGTRENNQFSKYYEYEFMPVGARDCCTRPRRRVQQKGTRNGSKSVAKLC
jgi:hypothetical protein